MAALAPLLPYVGAAGGILSFMGQRQQAAAYKTQAAQEQRIANMQAMQEVAAGQQTAMEDQRRAALMSSRALAVSAASGAGAGDPTAVRIMSNITQQGAYNAAVDTYNAEEKANILRMTGKADTNIAAEKSNALNVSSYGSLFDTASSLYSRFGGGGPGYMMDQGIEG